MNRLIKLPFLDSLCKYLTELSLFVFTYFQGAMLLRHHNEAESLHAVQKLDWGWKMKELALCDMKSSPVIDDICVPMVHVSDDFDLLPA